MRSLRDTDVKRLNRQWRRRTEGRVALLLDDVQNPFNVGSIVRNAAAFRVQHLYLAGATPAPTHPKTRKTSLGTERYVTWSEHAAVDEAVRAAAEDGFRLVGLELADGAVPLHEAEIPTEVCIAVGHEDRGLSGACLQACEVVAYVPQLGRVGSLNVAQAAAIAVYEARRRAWTP